MKKSPKGKNAMMKMAINQNIMGQVFIMGAGPNGEPTLTPTRSDEQEPYRIIDGQPVYHVSKNTFHEEIPYWQSNRVHYWGFIYHPNLLGSCFPIPATANFYIDTRVPGYYILWTRTVSDDENAEGMGPSHDVIAWTPRVKETPSSQPAIALFTPSCSRSSWRRMGNGTATLTLPEASFVPWRSSGSWGQSPSRSRTPKRS